MITNDNNKIVGLIQTYLQEDKATELLIKLDEEIGKKTDNTAIKQVLSGLRDVVDKPIPPSPWWLWWSFYTLVVFHIIMIIVIVMAFFILPFCAAWYIAAPLMTFIFFFSTTRVECHLTNLENSLRKKLGLKKIGGFVGHYFVKPAKIAILRWRRKRS